MLNNFDVKENKSLFLYSLIFYKYEYNGNKEVMNVVSSFEETEEYIVERNDFKNGTCEEVEGKVVVDNHWKQFPKFGDYMHLCKEERCFLFFVQNTKASMLVDT